ncbi:Uncharacterised protein [Vibrio cholerae]|nr:Uncharacterised protein [Vibrio cholerae]
MEDVAVSHFAQWAIGPDQIVNRIHALNVHCQTLNTVSDFAGHRLTLKTANLLEVSELSHFHAV